MGMLENVYLVTKISPQATRPYEPITGNCGNSLLGEVCNKIVGHQNQPMSTNVFNFWAAARLTPFGYHLHNVLVFIHPLFPFKLFCPPH